LKELNLASKLRMLFGKVLERDRKRVVILVELVEGFASEAETGRGDWVFVVRELVEDLEVDFGWERCKG
jgi:hypothetical protein